jgi:hypothetical protein
VSLIMSKVWLIQPSTEATSLDSWRNTVDPHDERSASAVPLRSARL